MSTDDRSDLNAVRALTSPRTATTLEELTRLRYRVLHAGAPRPRRRAWLAPVAAAVVALAVLAGVGVALHRGDPQGTGLAPAPSGTLELGATIDPRPGWDDLVRAAGQTEPLTAGAQDQLHVRMTMLVPAGGPGRDLVPQVRDTWYEVRGMIPVRDLTDGRPAGPGPKGEDETELERQSFASAGPGVVHPTPEWLAGLSPDPSALREQLGAAESTDSLWTTCTSLLLRVDPLLPTGVRVALLRLLGRIDTLVLQEVTVGGQRMIGVGRPSGQSLAMVLFDPATAHVTGWAQLTRGGDGPSPSPGVRDTRPSPGGVRVGDQRLYAYELVQR
ncbi:hypothetical protein ACQP2P_25225 [Dactylosporangium sp. CA-139114]|uniref:hypothetical protein n=1 Tax=Dactylosporangium sp. CA-139114 TaxID=3239931 RepID=UPI003D9650D9